MGRTYSDVVLESTFRQRSLPVRALVDSGSVFMIIPSHVAIQLGFDLEEVGTREVILADGSRKAVPMVGPLRVHFGDRYCDLSALVFGDEPRLGAVPIPQGQTTFCACRTANEAVIGSMTCLSAWRLMKSPGQFAGRIT